MSRIAYTARIAAATIALIGAVLVLVLAWGLRPAVPNVTAPGRGQSITPVLEQVGVDIAWLVAVCLLVSVVARTLAAITHTEPPRHRQAAARLNDVLAVQPLRRGPSVRRMPHREGVRPYRLVLQAPGVLHADLAVKQSPDESSSHEHVAAKQAVDRSISLLGPLTIQGARQHGRRMRSLTTEMLVYLALHSEGVTVERLADTLLPDTDFKKARGRIWQSATEAKRVLGESFHRDSNGRYQLDRDTIRIDLDELNELLAAQSTTNSATEAQHLERALDLFHGAPLADTDFPWAASNVRRLRATYVDLLEQVGLTRLDAGDARGAIEAAERGIQIDRFNEDLWRLAMQADYRLGLRDSINDRYEHLQGLLDRELGLEPSRETRHLCLDLLSQRRT